MKPDASERNTMLSPDASTRPATNVAASAPTPPPPAPPSLPATRFVDEGELGRGGMAVVRRVRDEALMRTVAMKRLDPFANEGTTAYSERLVDEAQITGQLDHPNIVPVHELGTDDSGRPYIVMKLVSGRTLASVLADTKPPRAPETLAELLGVFVTVCDAIAFAHSKGVLHCDLKPLNVMVDAFGQVYVMDWGLARLLPDAAPSATSAHLVRARRPQTDPDEGAGTVWYMAPEQVRPRWRPMSERTDVFALGAILYEILTGRPPHQGDTAIAARLNAFECRIDPPDRLYSPGLVPPALARIAMKALARHPDDRWQKVEDLRNAVHRFLLGGEQFVTRRFPAGTLVVREGDVGDAAYVITEGRCQAFKGEGEAKIVLREMGPGEVFGELAVLSDKPRTASIEAITDLVVREVKAEAVAEGLGLNTWMGAFVRALADRFREVDEKLTAVTRAKEDE